jgi:hypothetical protein
MCGWLAIVANAGATTVFAGLMVAEGVAILGV